MIKHFASDCWTFLFQPIIQLRWSPNSKLIKICEVCITNQLSLAKRTVKFKKLAFNVGTPKVNTLKETA